MEERISKKELLQMYGIDRVTFEIWRKRFKLPVIEISTHSKYVRKSDLIEWEDKMKKQNNSFVNS